MLTHQTSYRVIYGDTDNMGIAYYANYLRWFEIGRTEMLRHWGMPYHDIESQGFFMPVAEAQCRYLTPAKYDDLLVIEASLDTDIKGGFKINYRILSHDLETIHATGFTLHAFVDGDGRVVRPPEFLRQLIRGKDDQKP